MTSLLEFGTTLLIVCTMVQSALQMSATYVQRKEPTYNFFYNVNEPNTRLIKSPEEIRNYANSAGYFVANSAGSQRNSDYQTHNQHQNYDFVPKNVQTIFPTPQATPHPGYPRQGRPMGPQFNPAPGVRQTPHRLIPGYEKEKLPPGYVPLVAKIDTPPGYKLLDDIKLTHKLY